MNSHQLVLKNHRFDHAEVIRYPDWQRDVILDKEYFKDIKKPVEITCQITNFDDLELLCAAVSAIRWQDMIVKQINFVYLFGARSDRRFHPWQSNYFRDVITPILNNLRCNMSFLALHGRSEEFIDLLKMHKWLQPINEDTNCLDEFDLTFYNKNYAEKQIIIHADKSAVDILDCYTWNNDDPISFCKTRNEDGTIDSFLDLDDFHKVSQSSFDTILLVDDLCDGGATFIEEANYLKRHFPDKKLELFVVHGLFSKGVDHVAAHFDRIITTNSYQDFPQNPNDPLRVTDKLKVIKVI